MGNRVRFERLASAAEYLNPSIALYQADTERVLADLKDLPASARAWTTYYLYMISGGRNYVDPTAVEKAALSAFKNLGPVEAIRILQTKPTGKHPDFQPRLIESIKNDPVKGRFWRQLEEYPPVFFPSLDGKDFILHYARELLRPEDVPLLLAGEKTAKPDEAAAWAVAAAEVAYGRSPSQSKGIIKEAMKRYPPTKQAALQAVLWRREGMKARRELINWFYTVSEATRGPSAILRYIHRAERADTNKFLAAIVADKRFNQTEYDVLGPLLEIVNQDLPKPLVPIEEIRHSSKVSIVMAEWRELLRKHFSNTGKKPGR
ncbi:MAG: hypothetical protein K0Q55_2131 [Verrucomicrobia bacterium]|nr:hypothetical protein [Verrucomicrobiota bacterium]